MVFDLKQAVRSRTRCTTSSTCTRITVSLQKNDTVITSTQQQNTTDHRYEQKKRKPKNQSTKATTTATDRLAYERKKERHYISNELKLKLKFEREREREVILEYSTRRLQYNTYSTTVFE
jgi:hypothetical protein